MTADHRTLAEAYPPIGLRISAGPVELAGIDDDTAIELANLAADGVHPPDRMPFLHPWTLTTPDRFHVEFLRYHWGLRARFAPDAWSLDLAVRHDGELVGTQGVVTNDFRRTRAGETGSWLGLRHQGRGIGTLMRRTLCAFLFDELGFEQVTSSAFADNVASNRVSLAVGYRPNGTHRSARGEGWATNNDYLLTPDALVRPPTLSVQGAEPLRRFLGLAEAVPNG